MQNLISEPLFINQTKELDFLPVAIFIVDNQGIILYKNSEAKKILTFEYSKLDNITELSSSFNKQDFLQVITKYIKKPRQTYETLLTINHRTITSRLQLKMVAHQENKNSYLIMLYPVDNVNFSSDSDPALLKKDFKNLKQFSRLNAMREISAFIADQLNQPLTAILSYTQAMQRLYLEHATSKEITDAMERVVINAKNTGQLIHELRTQSQLNTNTLHYQSICINQLIQECIDFTDLNYFKSRILLKTDYDPSSSSVCVDSVQLKQVIISLLNNAIDATMDENIKNPMIIIETSFNDLYCKIHIKDNGSGISDSVRNKLFEPFITTKKEGIGIGLSMCQHIINLHKGSIEIISNNKPDLKETGTLIKINIPRLYNGLNRCH